MLTRLTRLLFPLHLICIVVVLLQPTTPAVFIGRYSRTSLLFLIALAVTLPIVWLAPRWLRTRHDTFLRQVAPGAFGLMFVGCAVAVFGLWFLIDNPTPSYIVLRLYLTLLLATAALGALERAPLAIDSVGVVYVVTLISLGAEIGALALATRFPGLLWTDEGYNTSLAISFAQYGILGVPSMQYASSGPLYSIVYIGLGAWYSVFGVTLAVGRIFTMLAGMLALQFVFFAARRAYSRYAATVAVIVGLGAIIAMNYLRADIGVSVFTAIAIYCFAVAEYQRDGTLDGGRPWFHLLVGAAVGFSLDGHPSAYRFVVAFGLAYVLEYVILVWRRRGLVFPRALLLFITGGMLGLGGYIVLYSALAPNTFLPNLRNPNVIGGGFSANRAIELLAAQLDSVLINMPVLLGCGLLGIVAAIGRRSPMDRLLTVVMLVNILIFAVTYSYNRDYYALHNAALLAMLAAAGFFALQSMPDRGEHQLIGAAILVTASALGVVSGRVRTAAAQDYGQALVVADEVRKVVPADERVVGIDPFMFRMADYANFIDMNAGAVLAARDNISEQEAWERLAPSSVVIVRAYPIKPPEALIAYTQAHDLIRVKCWETSRLGKVELFMQASGSTPDGQCKPLSE